MVNSESEMDRFGHFLTQSRGAGQVGAPRAAPASRLTAPDTVDGPGPLRRGPGACRSENYLIRRFMTVVAGA